MHAPDTDPIILNIGLLCHVYTQGSKQELFFFILSTSLCNYQYSAQVLTGFLNLSFNQEVSIRGEVMKRAEKTFFLQEPFCG